MAQGVDIANAQAPQNPPDMGEAEGKWTATGGRASTGGFAEQFNDQGVEPITYNNPFRQNIERVWFDGKLVYALDVGDVELPSAEGVKVAKEYQPVYSVELDEKGKLAHKEEIPGQLNIYDSVPGMEKYSPIWQFYYVIVPRDYQVNSLRSEQDCRSSGYTIRESNVFEN